MHLTHSYNAEFHIIEITCKGKMSFEKLVAEQNPTFALAMEKNTNKFLLDLSEYEQSLSTINIMNSVSGYGEKTTRDICIAIISPICEDARQDIRFYETVCLNRGWNVRMFSLRHDAINWLAN